MDQKNGALAVSGKVLIVAGSDSSGGAGIVRDVETVAAFGVKAAVAITAVTAQSDRHVTAVQAMEPALVAAQMAAALEGDAIRAVKIGMLANAGIVTAVADLLACHPDIPVVLDPVLASTSGKVLLEPEGVRLMIARLLPRADLVTPNLPELALLTGLPDMEARMRGLLALGVRAALIKGGHANDGEGDRKFGAEAAEHAPSSQGPTLGICRDLLIRPGTESLGFESPRHPGRLRGTGCMLASAIASGLARGEALEAAIERAKAHVSAAFVAAQTSKQR